jgi:hypothetical protein
MPTEWVTWARAQFDRRFRSCSVSSISRFYDRGAAVIGLLRFLFLGGLLIAAPVFGKASERDEKPDPVALWAALEDAKTLLESGLVASEPRGMPLSARFDLEDGDLQLIVYLATNDGFAQAIVDTNTGVVRWSEPISAVDDLADASAQKAAIDRSKLSLLSIVNQAVRDNQGARAVDVTPVLQEGHPLALITLLVNGRFVKVSRLME